jgi:hypothetical protein
VSFFLNLIFSHVDIERNFDIPTMLIIFAVLSTLFSNGLSLYVVRPFRYLSGLITEYSQQEGVAIQRSYQHISTIKELNELAQCLMVGLKAIKSKMKGKQRQSDELRRYANAIRDPVAALRLWVRGLTSIGSSEKTELFAITEAIATRTQQLLAPTELSSDATEPISPASNTVVIVDDNESLAAVWRQEASQAGIALCVFQTAAAFREALAALDKSVILCIDQYLEQGISGMDVAREAHEHGFQRIYVITADPQLPPKADWMRGVIDKAALSLRELVDAANEK